MAWALRLSWFLFTTRILVGHKDPRYAMIRQKRGLGEIGFSLYQMIFQAFLVKFLKIINLLFSR